MDRLLLKLTDKVGDYLQESRGVPLPSIHYAVVNAYVAMIMANLASYFTDMYVFGSAAWTYVLGLGLVIFWTPIVLFRNQQLKRLRSDAEVYHENEAVQKKYMVLAVTIRELVIPRWITLAGTFFVASQLVVLILVGGRLGVTIPVVFIFFLVGLALQYAECIIPKAPNQRAREWKLATESI